jgi:hypothetical protein
MDASGNSAAAYLDRSRTRFPTRSLFFGGIFRDGSRIPNRLSLRYLDQSRRARAAHSNAKARKVVLRAVNDVAPVRRLELPLGVFNERGFERSAAK